MSFSTMHHSRLYAGAVAILAGLGAIWAMSPPPTSRAADRGESVAGGAVGADFLLELQTLAEASGDATARRLPLEASASNAPSPEKGAADPLPARGQELFAKQCAVCHGATGDGAGVFAYLMNPRPRNFQLGKFKLSSTVNQIPTDDDLLRTISNGMSGSAMPPWGHLPRTDLLALVAFVRSVHVNAVKTDLERAVAEGRLSKGEAPQLLAERTQPGPPLVVPPEPAFDHLRWFRGRSIYLEACASCHGVDGEPVPEAVKYDQDGYPNPPRSFVSGIFKGGSEGNQLYTRIVQGINGTPMPSYKGTYSDDEIWDLVHYVQSLARNGAQERAQLRQGAFSAPNVRGPLPTGPLDPAWDQARPLYVALTPLWWTDKRIEGLVVQALHNDADIALRISWLDPTVDDRGVRQNEFRDAVAIQFSLSSDAPFYMGDKSQGGGVNMWMWKADRQTNIAKGFQDIDSAFADQVVDLYPERQDVAAGTRVQDRPPDSIGVHNPEFITAWGAGNLVANPQLATPVECLVARGPGTLSAKPAEVQLVQGQAVYERGVWYVQMQRTMTLPCEHGEEDERVFRSGDYLPVSFAIWNGSAGDRDGKKNISIWQKLVIE